MIGAVVSTSRRVVEDLGKLSPFLGEGDDLGYLRIPCISIRCLENATVCRSVAGSLLFRKGIFQGKI